ncbi:MAG TPA: TetR/AcrR family transcriptional regulator [Spirillospora sp.]|nr:TetR/AcrR family transcriptional regulator [Spirillospora sp.]
MPHKEDLRVRRTRTLLREALIELIGERGLERVTVGEITERAMVSRAAFYRNYRDKYHLVEQVFDEAMDALFGTVGGDERPPRERWTAFFEHIGEYHRLYGALLGRKGSPWFADRMRGSLAAMVTEHLAGAGPSARASADGLVPTVLGAMFVQSITWWLEHDRAMPPAEIAARTGEMAGALLRRAGAGPS